jgi:GGDEF domain-containing protein
LDRELVEAERYGHHSAFVLFRLDGRPKLEGHNLPHELTLCLADNIRETDYLASIDGKTTGVILKNATVENTGKAIDRLKEEIRLRLTYAHRTPRFRVSSAVCPTEANTFDSIKSLAEARLEEASRLF